jgi:hypothetical protein
VRGARGWSGGAGEPGFEGDNGARAEGSLSLSRHGQWSTAVRAATRRRLGARGHVPSLTPRTLCEEYPRVRQEQLGVLKQRAVPRVRVDDQLGVGDVLG